MRPVKRMTAGAARALCLAACLLAGCAAADLNDPRQRREIISDVWAKVDANFYDPQFNGVDWPAVKQRYLAEAEAPQSGEQFYPLVDRMLAELRSSHVGFQRPAPFKRREGLDVGVTVEFADGVYAVASVRPGPARDQRLRPGMVVRAVDGVPVAEHAERLEELIRRHTGVVTPQGRAGLVRKVFFIGDVGTKVEITVAESGPGTGGGSTGPTTGGPTTGGVERTVRLVRARSDDKPFVEYKVLPSGYGYLRFSAWVEPNDRLIEKKLDDINTRPGLVIDLRGNPGGNDEPTERITSMFFPKPVFWGTVVKRRGPERRLFTRKSRRHFGGPLVVLIDEGSGSASENFAALVQESGRGKLAGRPSCGCLTGTRWDKVKGGGKVGYPDRIAYTSRGVKIEGEGLTPDVQAAPSLADLSDGRDPALLAAVAILRESGAR